MSVGRLIVCAFAVYAASISVVAQTVTPSADGANPGASPGEGASQPQTATAEEEAAPTYLDRHIDSQINQRLDPMLTRDEARLAVVVRNFGAGIENGPQSLEKIQNLHAEGIALHYRRKYSEARKKLEEARKEALDLYKRAAVLFHKQLDEVLVEAARKIAESERRLYTEPAGGLAAGSSTPGSAEVARARFHLQNAYTELGNAEELEIVQNFDTALDHLRLSRLFAIHALMSLEDEPQKRRELEQRYGVMLADSNGRSAQAANHEGGAPAAPAAAQ